MKTTIIYETNGDTHKFISSNVVKVTVPLLVTESTIFRETWYISPVCFLNFSFSFIIYSVFLKVELSCNGELPVRIFGSHAKPSTYYLVESESKLAECDLVNW